MKYYFLALLCLTPWMANATKLANCDTKPYNITINNAGQVHVVTLTPNSGSIEEFGPVVSMQIEGQRPIVISEPYDEYCIWKGKITLQRRNPGNEQGGGFGSR